MIGSIGLVWAQAANGVIGRDGSIPWRLPKNMAHFRDLTSSATVVSWLPARRGRRMGPHQLNHASAVLNVVEHHCARLTIG